MVEVSMELRALAERVYRQGLSDGWRCNQRGKLSAPAAFDEEWFYYVKNGALAKSIESVAPEIAAALRARAALLDSPIEKGDGNADPS